MWAKPEPSPPGTSVPSIMTFLNASSDAQADLFGLPIPNLFAQTCNAMDALIFGVFLLCSLVDQHIVLEFLIVLDLLM